VPFGAFSSLIIGIWAAAREVQAWAILERVFQFPHHRDLGCSGKLADIREARGGCFQFPHHRDLGCSPIIGYLIYFKGT